MINPATREAGRILAVRPGLCTGELLDAIPAAGAETIAALHHDGHTYGYGQDVDGLWWLARDNDLVARFLAEGKPTPREIEFTAAQEDRQWRKTG